MPGARAALLVDCFWRTVFRIGFPLARSWWRLRRPPHEGALVAIHVGAAILLVRSSYRREWNFPGGGVERGEHPEAAARRELQEEIGVTELVMTQAGEARGLWDCRRDRVHFFAAHLDQLPALRIDNREIVEARLMTSDQRAGVRLTGPVEIYLRRVDMAFSETPPAALLRY